MFGHFTGHENSRRYEHFVWHCASLREEAQVLMAKLIGHCSGCWLFATGCDTLQRGVSHIPPQFPRFIYDPCSRPFWNYDEISITWDWTLFVMIEIMLKPFFAGWHYFESSHWLVSESTCEWQAITISSQRYWPWITKSIGCSTCQTWTGDLVSHREQMMFFAGEPSWTMGNRQFLCIFLCAARSWQVKMSEVATAPNEIPHRNKRSKAT